MKKLVLALILPLFLLNFSHAQTEADSTGFDGDHFSLEGALELFKESKSLEDFEKKLNTEKNHVNNLDLNKDGDTDYIRVEDNMDGDVHAIVLQVPVSADESQDVAVIEIEKTGKEEAMLQIVGDEEVYGETKLVEPFQVEAQQSKDNRGPHAATLTYTHVHVNVYFWAPIRVIYAPAYRPWRSPYRWHHYPRWWSPWRPVTWRAHHRHVHVHHRHYHRVHTHRVVRAHRVYTPHRRSSTVVRKRTTTVRTVRATNGNKVVKRKTTTTTTKGKNGKVVKQKKTTTAGKGKNGKVVKQKKTTTVKGKKGKVTKQKKTTTVKKKRGNKKAGVKRTTTKRKRRKN